MSKLDSAVNEYFLTKYRHDGEFTLASGKISNVYWDFRPLLLDSNDALLFSQIFSSYIQDNFPNDSVNVVGLEFWGACFVPLIPYLCFQSPLSIPVILRKEKAHGIQDRLIGREKIQPANPIILLDDVVTTGKSLRNAIDYLQGEGITLARIVVLLNRGYISSILGTQVDSIFQLGVDK